MSTRLLALLGLIALALVGPAHAQPAPGFDDTVFQGSLSAPTAIAFLPNGKMLITEKGGALKLSDGSSVSTLITLGVCTDSEMGLLGVAVDPNFSSNGFIYLYRTDNSAGCGSATGRFNQVVRVTMGSGGTVSPGSLLVLLTGIRTDNGNHDGGGLRIGPDDGKLYVGVGDTGIGDQMAPGLATNPYAQDLSSLNGKVLRLNLDGTIPSDNPFVGQAGKRGEIYAYGFRNPFRFSFDPVNHNLWVGDVGDLTVEEIDIVTSGGNYAWPHCEGRLPSGCEQAGDIDPIFTYLHPGSGGDLGSCVIGGAFAGPTNFGGFENDYFFADCTSFDVYHATPNAGRNGLGTPTFFADGIANSFPSDLIFGPDGALYYVNNGTGDVHRVAPTVPGGDEPVGGTKLTLKDNATNAEKKRLTMQSKDNVVLGASSDAPTAAGGSLRVVSASFDDTYDLPSGNWASIGDPADRKGFKYKDRLLAAGPIKSVIVKAGKLLKATGKGSALGDSLATNPDPVTVVLALGTRRYCATFGGTVKFEANKSFTAKLADAPTSCP